MRRCDSQSAQAHHLAQFPTAQKQPALYSGARPLYRPKQNAISARPIEFCPATKSPSPVRLATDVAAPSDVADLHRVYLDGDDARCVGAHLGPRAGHHGGHPNIQCTFHEVAGRMNMAVYQAWHG